METEAEGQSRLHLGYYISLCFKVVCEWGRFNNSYIRWVNHLNQEGKDTLEKKRTCS